MTTWSTQYVVAAGLISLSRCFFPSTRDMMAVEPMPMTYAMVRRITLNTVVMACPTRLKPATHPLRKSRNRFTFRIGLSLVHDEKNDHHKKQTMTIQANAPTAKESAQYDRKDRAQKEGAAPKTE